MEILKTGYGISTENYTRRTPIVLKFIADIMLLIAGITEILPDFSGKEWIVAGGIAFKIISKFITEHIPV